MRILIVIFFLISVNTAHTQNPTTAQVDSLKKIGFEITAIPQSDGSTLYKAKDLFLNNPAKKAMIDQQRMLLKDSPTFYGFYTNNSGKSGLEILHVVAGSNAALAGIEKGDVINFVNKKLVRSSSLLIKTLQSSKAGDLITLGITRAGQQLDKEFKLAVSPFISSAIANEAIRKQKIAELERLSLENARKEKEKREAERVEKELQDQLAKEQLEKEKLETEKLEKEKLAKIEKERKDKAEIERRAKAEAERKDKLEKERLAKAEKERLAKLEKEKTKQAEKERKAKLEKEKLAQKEKERLAKIEKDKQDKIEKDRLAKLEKERLAEAEKDRLAKEEDERLAKIEKDRQDKMAEEKRLAKAEQDRLAKIEKDLEAKKAEEDRLAKLEKDRLAKLERERLVAAEAEKKKLENEERKRLKEKERMAKKAAKAQAEKEAANKAVEPAAKKEETTEASTDNFYNIDEQDLKKINDIKSSLKNKWDNEKRASENPEYIEMTQEVASMILRDHGIQANAARNNEGAVITEITQNSYASKIFTVGDIIFSVDDNLVRNHIDLALVLEHIFQGDKVNLLLLRNNSVKKLKYKPLN